MGWSTQPVCENRFRQMEPGREPHRLRLPESEWEPCCYCRTLTNIYVRLDSDTVPFPRPKDD